MTTEEKARAYAESRIADKTVRVMCMTPREKRLERFDAYDIEQAYLAGATEALASQWKDPKVELPEDGNYLTLLHQKNGELTVEVAPWRNGIYQGGYTMSVYFKQISVKAWLPIPPLKEDPDTFDETDK